MQLPPDCFKLGKGGKLSDGSCQSLQPVICQFCECNNNIDCEGALVCDGNLKECRQEASNLSQPDMNFCSQNGRLCQEMEGDCDDDNECAGSLKCGTDNCILPKQSTWGSDFDCCYLPGDVWILNKFLYRYRVDPPGNTLVTEPSSLPYGP